MTLKAFTCEVENQTFAKQKSQTWHLTLNGDFELNPDDSDESPKLKPLGHHVTTIPADGGLSIMYGIPLAKNMNICEFHGTVFCVTIICQQQQPT